MPRFRRCGLDLSLARANGARLPRLGSPREPRAARRRLRRGRALLRRAIRRRGRRRQRRDAPRTSWRDVATPSQPTGCARRATPPPTRSRPSSTGWPRAEWRKGIKPRREDGVVRPLLTIWREETEAYCRAEGLEFRTDESNRDTKRGLIRDEILPRAARAPSGAPIGTCCVSPRASPRALDELLASPAGSKRLDLGGGLTAVREYDRVWLERTPGALDGAGALGRVAYRSELPGLKVRAWRAGDRLAGRSKKIQDVFVDAKIPRSARESWPLVVRGDEVVAVPGIVESGRSARRTCRRLSSSAESGRSSSTRTASVRVSSSSGRRSRPTTPGATCC